MVSLKDFHQRIEYGLFLAAFGLLRLLPLDWAVNLCASVWRFIGPRSRRHARALDNLKRAFPDMADAEHDRIALAMWDNMGRVVAETMLLDRILKQPERMEIVNRDHVTSLMAQPRRQIGVTLHMGNWEFAAWGCAACGGKPAGVYRQLENPHVDRTLRRHRENLYSGGLFTKGTVHDKSPGGQRTARLMTDFVRQGGNLAFVIDQVDRRGIAIPIFGGEAKFTPVPAMIARHVGARIWVARARRIGKATRFLIELKELEVKRTKNRQEDVHAATAAIFRQFESWIREAPEQWLWFNTRFENANLLEAAPPLEDVAESVAPISASLVNQTIH
jgi:Kdo2-lipid IVA lauroyltransferase/acyltransferase